MENKIIGARLKRSGKLIYLNPLEYTFKVGDLVMVNTEQGEEIARVVKIVEKELLPSDSNYEDVIRPVSKKDIKKQQENDEKANEALEFCKKQVKKLNLNMKLLKTEYTFDMSKLTFYFSSEDRVDFRELVKILASNYRARIELRQIGPRDEVKIYPNLGICGREVCCRSFLQDFEPVSIKMAKDQGLQINMPKLSGACGKLMCCLRYEEEAYKENINKLPKMGEIVSVTDEEEKGKVVGLDILKMKVKVKFGQNHDEERIEIVPVDKVKFKKRKQVKEEVEETDESYEIENNEEE